METGEVEYASCFDMYLLLQYITLNGQSPKRHLDYLLNLARFRGLAILAVSHQTLVLLGVSEVAITKRQEGLTSGARLLFWLMYSSFPLHPFHCFYCIPSMSTCNNTNHTLH